MLVSTGYNTSSSKETFPIPNWNEAGFTVSQTKKLTGMRRSKLRIRTLNQLAKETFARLACDFSKDWIPVSVTWKGEYLPRGESLYSENFLPACGITMGHRCECSIFGWSYREGIKEGILTKKGKAWEKDFTLRGMLKYLTSAKKESPCTLQEVLKQLASAMPHLSHFAVYTVNESAGYANFELYKIPKTVFRFNSKM